MFFNSKQNWFTVVLFVFLMISFRFHPVKAITDSEIQDQVVTFLTKVAGLDENSLSFSSFNVSHNSLFNSNIPRTGINAFLSNNNQNFSLSMDIVYGKVHFYSLSWLELPSSYSQIEIEESLGIIKNALKGYETNFGASYVNELTQILPTNVSTQDANIENENMRLKITHYEADSFKKDINFRWIKLIDGVEVPHSGLSISVSQNGLVTSFSDDIKLYRIVVSDHYISEEEAVSIGHHYINEYVKENGRTLVSVNSEFFYTRDIAAHRGDNYAIYPVWWITADFSGVSKEGVFGYSVLIWADTGEAYHFGSQGSMGSSADETTANAFYILIVGIAVIIAPLVIRVIYSHKRNTSNTTKHEATSGGRWI